MDRKKSQRNTCYLKKHLAPPPPRSVCALIYTLAASDFIENNAFLTKHIKISKYSNSLLVKASLTDCLQYQKTFEMALNKLQISSTNIHGNYS